MSIPIIESSANAVSLITGGVAAVVLVVSETSIDSLVDKIVEPIVWDLNFDYSNWGGQGVYNLAMPKGGGEEQLKYLQHANVYGSVKTVVLGLDFFAYSYYMSLPKDYRQERLYRTGVDGKYSRSITKDIFNALLSKDAIKSALDTLKSNQKRDVVFLLENGAMSKDGQLKLADKAGSYSSAFSRIQKNYMEKESLSPL